MKRFFTFLMAILALLSISQAVKAADVTVYFQSPDGWSTPVYAYVYDDASTPNHYKAWEKASGKLCRVIPTCRWFVVRFPIT